ncbi:MAG: undecaprenyldiphospho-muramoylpentapeptide beta-N-acetylglucosaminyltransferase [Firmicutes bacterium]|nr:undecaprenyldiphospho-muramoylpentapeptide beta-N-acetylglucosaminyltransferase [Bacillota bacterium]
MKIIVTGGGTGGHVFPALVLMQHLASHEIVYAGSSKGIEKKLVPAYGFHFLEIDSMPLTGKRILKNFIGILVLCKGTLQSLLFLFKFKPNLIIGTGGYVSFPVLAAGWILKIPTVLLEQNLLPGKTTRIFSRLSSCVCVSFEETAKFLPKVKTKFTGNPVRSEIGSIQHDAACAALGLSAERPVVLVMGASQGAKALNACLLEALRLMQDETWQILHLTGESHYHDVLQKAQGVQNKEALVYKAFPFADKMEIFYAASDLIVSRAGATTIAEILTAGKPSILIPYPYAADNHQEINARWLEEKKGCEMLLEKDLTPESFYRILKEWLSKPDKLKEAGKQAKLLSNPDAAEKIIAVLEETVKRESKTK